MKTNLRCADTSRRTTSYKIGNDEPVAMKYANNVSYYAQDGLGSTVALINVADNSVVAGYRYDTWGNIVNYTGSLATENPYLFTGREYDWQTGIYYYRARSYDAKLGRFLQRDPEGMVDGANMYVYCQNDPVNRVDPSGTAGWYICLALMLSLALTAYRTSSLMAHSEHWASHAFIGCSQRRAGCDYWTVRAQAWVLEALYPPIFIDMDSKDVSATLWGWYDYEWGGWCGPWWWRYRCNSCVTIALHFFPSQYTDDKPYALHDTSYIP
ncbi:MAG: RHS repeat-associated core domain-containing protein [Candidatus Thermoplasmatota archaeon]